MWTENKNSQYLFLLESSIISLYSKYFGNQIYSCKNWNFLKVCQECIAQLYSNKLMMEKSFLGSYVKQSWQENNDCQVKQIKSAIFLRNSVIW